MFMNLHQINHKRRNTLNLTKETQKLYERTFKSIENLKINSVNATKPK
jgi:hypothetical protein